MKLDLTQGKIYKISNDYNDDIYIGSTCNTLVKRYSQHKAYSKQEKYQPRPLYKLSNDIGFDRFRIQLIENYPCEDKYMLKQKEGEYIRELSTLNKRTAGRTTNEFQQTPKYKQYQKEYRKEYQQNPEYKEYQKEYKKEYKKEYQQTQGYKDYQ